VRLVVVPSVSSASPDGGYLSSVTCPTAAGVLGVRLGHHGGPARRLDPAGAMGRECLDPGHDPDADPSGGNILGAVACTGRPAAGRRLVRLLRGWGGSGSNPRLRRTVDRRFVVDRPSPTVGALAFLDSLTCARH